MTVENFENGAVEVCQSCPPDVAKPAVASARLGSYKMHMCAECALAQVDELQAAGWDVYLKRAYRVAPVEETVDEEFIPSSLFSPTSY